MRGFCNLSVVESLGTAEQNAESHAQHSSGLTVSGWRRPTFAVTVQLQNAPAPRYGLLTLPQSTEEEGVT